MSAGLEFDDFSVDMANYPPGSALEKFARFFFMTDRHLRSYKTYESDKKKQADA